MWYLKVPSKGCYSWFPSLLFFQQLIENKCAWKHVLNEPYFCQKEINWQLSAYNQNIVWCKSNSITPVFRIITGVLKTSTVSVHSESLLVKYVLQSSGISWKSAALIVRYSQKKECISFVFYCFENLSIAITSEPLVRFRWGFHQNVPLLMRTSIK